MNGLKHFIEKNSQTIQAVAAIGTVAALLVSLVNTCQTEESLRLALRMSEEEYSERLSIFGNLYLAKNDSYDYIVSASGDTVLSTLKLRTAFELVNNSRRPLSIRNVFYETRFMRDDSLHIHYHSQWIQRGAGTRSFPIRLEPSQSARIEDGIDVTFSGVFQPLIVSNNPSVWQKWPLPFTLSNMSMQVRWNKGKEPGLESATFDRYLVIIAQTTNDAEFKWTYYFDSGLHSQ